MEFVLRSSIILVAGLAALRVLRRQPASVRHWVMAAAILLAAVQPLATAMLPAIHLQPVERILIESQDAPEMTSTIPDGAAATREPAHPARVWNWPRLAYWLWLVGMVAGALVLAAGTIWLVWLGRRGRAAGASWQREADGLRARLGLRTPVRLIVTSHPAMLVTWGVFAPVILLPSGADAWPDDRIRHVVAHEIAHVVRRDWLIQLLSEVARAVNWFNPLFWIASARLRRDSELACDDVVLDLGFRGTSYASHLLDLARSFSVHGRTWLPAPSIARPSTLERRVRAMLNPLADRRPISNLRRAAIAVALLTLTLPIAAASQGNTPSGTVADQMGRRIADAVVRLVPTDGGTATETKTDGNGSFSFPAVAAGDYMLSVRHPGFSGKRHRVSLNGGGVTFNLQVQVGTLRETVTVGAGTGEVPATRQVQTSSTVPDVPASCTASDGGQIKPPMKLRDVRPRYKQEWAAAGLEGSVLMQATIGTDGKVRGLDVLSPGSSELEDEALAAVSGWQFSPTYLNCEPIEVQMFVTVNFKKP